MSEEYNRYQLKNRYIFTGRLEMETAFHIGGGLLSLHSSDSPVVLTPEGRPFIPGSSFKGSLRSTVEKIVPALGNANLWTCALIELSDEEKAQREKRKEAICSSLRQKEISDKYRDTPRNKESIFKEVRENLCSTCKLFGSPYTASLLSINDLYLADLTWLDGLIQRRDGVAIDRDSERARDKLKYDFEVVPATTTFDLKITLENASDTDLQLISIGLSEFVNGFGVIGGKRSRGLGACVLKDFKVQKLQLSSNSNKNDAIPEPGSIQRLKNYLLKGELEPEDGKKFLETHIHDIFPNNQ